MAPTCSCSLGPATATRHKPAQCASCLLVFVTRDDNSNLRQTGKPDLILIPSV